MSRFSLLPLHLVYTVVYWSAAAEEQNYNVDVSELETSKLFAPLFGAPRAYAVSDRSSAIPRYSSA